MTVDRRNLECNAAVEGMTCASCALLIEMSLQRDPRIEAAAVNFAAGTVSVKGRLSREALFASVKGLGYEARPMDTLAQRRLLVEREKARLEEARRRLLHSALLTAPVMVSGMLMHRSPALRLLELGLSSAVLFGPGREIFRKAWALAQRREANMDTLISHGRRRRLALQPARRLAAAPPCVFRIGGGHRRLRPRRPLHGRARQGQGLRGDPQAHRTAAGHGDTRHGRRRRDRGHRPGRGRRSPARAPRRQGAGRRRGRRGRSSLDESMLTGESLPVAKGALATPWSAAR
jgi:Cu+-exporting ATPase